jgi:hypothetical protein
LAYLGPPVGSLAPVYQARSNYGFELNGMVMVITYHKINIVGRCRGDIQRVIFVEYCRFKK